MSIIIKEILAHFAIFLAVFGVISFWNWSFDMGDWGGFSRFLFSLSAVVIVISIMNIDITVNQGKSIKKQ